MPGHREIVARALGRKLGRLGLNSLVESHADRSEAAYNEVALAIAEAFRSGELAYSDADDAMNTLWGMMLEDNIVVEPASSIYEAFDAGEYDHGDGREPVDAYTRPAIKQILREP